jgi:hypothetical protein
MAIISEHPWVELKRRNVFFFGYYNASSISDLDINFCL